MEPVAACEYSVDFEPPDTVVVMVSGHLTAQLVQTVTDQIQQIANDKPYIVQLVDIRNLEGASPDARAIGAGAGSRYASRGIAFFGGKPLVRILAGFVARSFVLLNGRARRDPIRFFPTESEARAWLAERRALIQAEIASGHDAK